MTNRVLKEHTGFSMNNLITTFAVFLLFLSGCSTVPKTFHPVQPLAPQAFSHAGLHKVLEEHVSDGIVKYPNIANDSRFLPYLDQLNRVDPNALPTRNDQLSFWGKTVTHRQ